MPQLPTRVIDVGHRAGEEHVQLYESRDGECEEYVALSHCWGDPDTVPKTTRGVIDQFRDAIPEDILSKTFSDAIQITRRLGFRYLWIDALCIIQDSAEDWNTESAKIGAVYGNATITIAAASSNDGRGGCLYDRQGVRQIRLERAAGLNTAMFLRFLLSHNSFDRRSVGTEALPLLGRKWTYQERIMSRRMVYYTNQEIVWECTDTRHCECDNVSHSNWVKLGFETPADRTVERLDQFYAMVDEYSKRDLTYHSDALPAFSAIASTFACKEFGLYAAGLWNANGSLLLHQLKWYVSASGLDGMNRSKSSIHRPSTYCGPTWSWVSVVGPITTSSARSMEPSQWRATVTSVRRNLSTEDPFGAITYAELTIIARGLMRKVLSVEQDGDEEWITYTPERQSIKCNIDTIDDIRTLAGENIWFVLLGKGLVPGEVYILLLRPMDNGSFQRIGIYRPDFLSDFKPGLRRAPKYDFKMT